MLRLKKDVVEVGSGPQQAFAQLLELDQTIWPRFAYQYLAWSLTKDATYVQGKIAAALRWFRFSIPTARVLNNIAVVWAGLSILKDFVVEQGYPVEIAQDLQCFLQANDYLHTPAGVRTQADELSELICNFYHLPLLGAMYDQATDILWFSLRRVHKTFNLHQEMSSVRLLFEERVGSYIVGPTRLDDGGEWWGVELGKAQAIGLDTPRPFATIDFEPKLISSLNGTGNKKKVVANV